jgi:hypothetical protein
MFCPSCGSEERQVSQFCRACGTDLRAVRTSLAKPDVITASAVSARDEIGHAIADKIRELETANDLKKVAEDVLPMIERWLESPQQRRLRGIRGGIVTSAVGLGATLFFLIWGLNETNMFFLMGLGLTAFLIGLGLIINALVFTVPKEYVPHASLDPRQRVPIDEAPDRIIAVQRELTTAEPLSSPPSVTEQTTHHLKDSPGKPARVGESG